MDPDVQYLEEAKEPLTWKRFVATYLRSFYSGYIDEVRDLFFLVNCLPLCETSGRFCIWYCRNSAIYVGFDRKFGWFYTEPLNPEFTYVDSLVISDIVLQEAVRTETGISDL